MSKQPALSLAFELSEILDAIEGVRILAHPLQELPGSAPSRERVNTVAGTLANLAMVAARLKQVVAAVRGEVDPRALLAAHNTAPDDDQPGVLLRVWDSEQVAEHAREVAKLAERQAQRRRGGRR